MTYYRTKVVLLQAKQPDKNNSGVMINSSVSTTYPSKGGMGQYEIYQTHCALKPALKMSFISKEYPSSQGFSVL